MRDRFLAWLAAGAVTAGVTAGMLATAGMAAALPDAGGDDGATTASEPAKTPDAQQDSTPPSGTEPAAGTEEPDTAPADDPDAPVAEPGDEVTPPAEDGDEVIADIEDEVADEVVAPVTDGPDQIQQPDSPSHNSPEPPVTTAAELTEKTNPVAVDPVEPTVVTPPAEPTTRTDDAPPARAAAVVIDQPDEQPAVARTAMAAAPEQATATATATVPGSSVILNVIGAVIFGLYNLALRLFEGPPILPAGSTVTVRTSTLHFDYGSGYDLPANWYFPEDPDPTRLIFLQHGFMASAPLYSYTAATLAEQTHSIVVAVSASSNFLAWDGFWLGGAPYQQSVADLFTGDRTALDQSADAAAGYDVTLPQRFVIAGHSAGGGLALGAASYLVENGAIGDLAGLLLLDGVAMGGDATALIDSLPDDLPIYQLGAPPYAWNLFGATSDALVAARPGQFNGVQLNGGSHIDSMQGGNGIIQFGAYLVAGFSTQPNIEAARILMVDWVNAMFDDQDVAGTPGATIPIPTPAGEATAVVLGSPPAALAGGQSVSLAARREDAELITAAAAPSNPLLPGATNGVTGVRIGHSRLAIPGAFIGDSVAADWYFPTQADGTVAPQGVIWLQHGFAATNTLYSALATQLATRTNSVVVAPTLSSIPITFSGGCLNCALSQQAASAALLDPGRAALIASAQAAGYTGPLAALTGKFVLAGHSAGGGFATAVASDYLNDGSAAQDAQLIGVVMFDGVSNGAGDGSFAQQVAVLRDAGKPIYQIAAPAQAWNAYGATTNALLRALPGQFAGVVLAGGSHVDSMIGVNPLVDAVLQLVTGRVPAGNTAAVYTLSTGWINDMYVAAGPLAPQYGFYAAANQQIIMGPTAALALPSPVLNQLSFVDRVLTTVIDAVGGLFGFSILPDPVNTGSNGLDPADPVVRPVYSNGVTGVRTGSATLDIPCGDTGYGAPATWYFPTQADGSITANGLIWLQHGFLGFDPWYSDMAQALAQETNSIVVAPTIFWFDTPLCPGCFLGGPAMWEAAASMFSDSRSGLTVSANAAGLQGPLPEKFVLAGHSAGGNFATAVGSLLVGTAQEDNLLGVVMFDGVSRAPLFTESLAALGGADVPVYQIAAPPQSWNAWGVTTETMVATYPNRFNGLQIVNGSHTDVIEGDSLFAQLADVLSSIVVRPSPPGAKAAVRTLATGWVNDIYAGNTTYATNPAEPIYGIYGPAGEGPQDYSGGNQNVVLGEATAATLPSPPPVTVADYLGTWYEQGSVPQFFSIGLVNTTAQYTLNPDGSIRVENSGYYFSPDFLKSTIVGAAVPVNAANTRLNVGFFFGQPSAAEPGNYWILDYAPDYSWAIVSDPTLLSGYLLTRDQIISEDAYQQLRDRAVQLGVRGPILRTRQFAPATATVAA